MAHQTALFWRRLAATLTVLLVCVEASPVTAQMLPIVFPSDKVKVIIGKSDSFDLRANSGRMTIMEFTDKVSRAYSTSTSYYVQQRGDHRVDLKLKRDHPADVATVTIETTDNHAINVGVVPTEEAIEVPKYVEVETLTHAQLEERKRNQLTTSQLLHRHEWLTVNRRPVPESPIYAEILGLTTLNERQDDGSIKSKRFLKFCIQNRTSRAYPLATIMIIDDNRERRRAQAVAIDTPGDTQRGFLLATIPAETRVEGAVMVPDSLHGALHELSLTFSDPAGIRPLLATTEQADWVLLRTKDYERERRELLLARQVTFGVQVIGGAMWLANPQNPEIVDATNITGFGLRAAYGLHTLFALEGEIVAARTGTARFSDTWQSTTGELTRQATVGRVLLGGVARLGRKYIPTVRFGLGFQGSSHSSDFIADSGQSMDGPEVPMEWDFLLSLSAGLDVRIGDHWLVGFQVSGVRSDAIDVLSLSGGIHVGYGWIPDHQRLK